MFLLIFQFSYLNKLNIAKHIVKNFTKIKLISKESKITYIC